MSVELMTVEKRDDGWWILNCPEGYALEGWPGIGPYKTQAEALEDRRGLIRSSRMKPEDWTTDRG